MIGNNIFIYLFNFEDDDNDIMLNTKNDDGFI